VVRDQDPDANGRTAEIQAPVVINATGAWADELRARVSLRRPLRKIRGSHLVFPWKKLPLTRAVSFLHPIDGRAVFVFPWEGVTIYGTTDIDHHTDMDVDPSISQAEVDYLMAGAAKVFPDLNLDLSDVQGTFAGVRAVIDTGKTDPSKESREHVIWNESGLLTVSGGKLTTFRLIAHAALRAVRRQLPGRPVLDRNLRVLNRSPAESALYANLNPASRLWLVGRHGADAPAILTAAASDELEPIAGSPALWAELRWAARAEGVVHLDDLLLRRVRLGLLLPEGGIQLMPRIRAIAQPELNWDDERWTHEVQAYSHLWKTCCYLPAPI
jgi:glycerol-3-phosphate dehydrogenase